jgi:glutathione S-transferase
LQWFHFGEATLARHAAELIRHQYGLPEEERVPSAVDYARRRFRGAIALIDECWLDREFILGSDFSAADIALSFGTTKMKIAHELPASAPTERTTCLQVAWLRRVVRASTTAEPRS